MRRVARHTSRTFTQTAWLRITTAVVAAGALLPPAAALAEDQPARIAILIRAQATHRRAAEALETTLQREGLSFSRIELPRVGSPAEEQKALRELEGLKPTLIAAAGSRATELALKTVPDCPVIFLLVPNVLDAPFLRDSESRARVAGVTTDISPDVQVEWLREAAPGIRTVAILYSDRSTKTARAVQSSAGKRGIDITLIQAQRDDFGEAIENLNRSGCDAALMIPDATVYSSPSVQRLLLWGMRKKCAVMAFSGKITKAGAFGSVQADVTDIGRQTARLILSSLRGVAVADLGINYPERVERAINSRTAKAIERHLPWQVIPAEVSVYGRE